MSLAIDIDKVKSVLLPDGVWHEVNNKSFLLDAYEYKWAPDPGDIQYFHFSEMAGISVTGFSFFEKGINEDGSEYERRIAGSITNLLAVTYE